MLTTIDQLNAALGAPYDQVEWASSDAFWRLEQSIGAPDRYVLVRYPFDSRSGSLSPAGDTIYNGTASYFDVTRDGNNIVLSEGSTTHEAWALELRDALRGQFPADRKLESSTTPTNSEISRDGQRVTTARSLAPHFELSIRPFGGGPATSLSLGDVLGAGLADSVTVLYAKARGRRLELGTVDARTGATRDSLLLPSDATLDAVTTLGYAPPDGWMWKTRTGPLMLKRRGQSTARVLPLSDGLGIVTSLLASVDGRRLAIAAQPKSAADSTLIVVMDINGRSPVVWARVGGTATPIMGDNLTGFVDYPSVFALDAPGRVRLIGTVPRWGSISVSADLKRAVFNTSEYHGDAWVTKVVRR